MPRTKQQESDFGSRLVALRKAHGLSQGQLAHAVGVSQRVMCYYEREASYPPAPVVVRLAQTLHVSTDVLLGVKTARTKIAKENPEVRRLWRQFQLVLALPQRDQRAVTRLILSLARSRASLNHASAGEKQETRRRAA